MVGNDFFKLSDFEEYCKSRNWTIDGYTSEFTLQFRLCRFFEHKYNDIEVELESNTQRYELSKLEKKELDIDISHRQKKIAIELKFIRDGGSCDLGMIGCCKDVRFVEQLKESGKFDCGYTIIFTTVPSLYTPTGKSVRESNELLYNSFRKDKCLPKQQKLTLQIRQKSTHIVLNNSYPLEWTDFLLGSTHLGVKACVIKI